MSALHIDICIPTHSFISFYAQPAEFTQLKKKKKNCFKISKAHLPILGYNY